MTDFSLYFVVAFVLFGATVLAEFLYSLGTVFFFVFIVGVAWLAVRVWKGINNG